MPDDRSDDKPGVTPPFFARLTAEGRELVPVVYRRFDTPSLEFTDRMRTAASDWYNAAGFSCFGFYKPISRCRRHDEP